MKKVITTFRVKRKMTIVQFCSKEVSYLPGWKSWEELYEIIQKEKIVEKFFEEYKGTQQRISYEDLAKLVDKKIFPERWKSKTQTFTTKNGKTAAASGVLYSTPEQMEEYLKNDPFFC